jgi:hypothetical protein
MHLIDGHLEQHILAPNPYNPLPKKQTKTEHDQQQERPTTEEDEPIKKSVRKPFIEVAKSGNRKANPHQYTRDNQYTYQNADIENGIRY